MDELWVMLFLGAPIIGGGILVLWLYVRESGVLGVPNDWAATQGTIVATRLEEVVLRLRRPPPGLEPPMSIVEDTYPRWWGRRSWKRRYWLVHVTYQYVVDGRVYTIESLADGHWRTQDAAKMSAAEQYGPGAAIGVRYDPKDPASARLAEGAPLGDILPG
jgi:hypothetical protein